jgi:uncharacterized membrane protein YagU involved in acid resistance
MFVYVVSREGRVTLIREALRTGIAAGLAMIPFAAVFQRFGLRVNEYGRKTLALLVGDVSAPLHYLLAFIQHLAISWVVAVPLLLLLGRRLRKRGQLLVGLAYGAFFYVAVNSLALPFAFGDPTPWRLGFAVVYPSLLIHLVYGFTVALLARPAAALARSRTPHEPEPR